ncbi:MAG: ABC transporter ATP-binding protein/permease [Defluviitaleaceae bacterium]|nr:ABC transporter ATP-binding protein/permease [Defluviitaleaceae bacterium]
MKLLWRIAGEAKRYKGLLILGGLATLALLAVNLMAPRYLSQITGIVEGGIDSYGVSEAMRLALILLALYVGRIILRFMASYIPHVAAWRLVEDMRVRVYDRIQSYSMRFFHDKQTGDLMSRVVNDTGTFELLYAHIIPETITNSLMLIAVTIILVMRDAQLALMTAIPIPFILISAWILMKKVRPMFRKMQKSLGALNSQLQDNFSGVQEIQAFCQQEKESKNVFGKANDVTVYMLRALKYSAVFHPSVEFLTSLGTVIVVGFGGWMAYTRGLGLEDMVFFLLYLGMFYGPLTGLANLVEGAQNAFAGTERVLEVMDYESEIKDAPDAEDLPEIKGHIEFRNVSFNYIDGVPVLNDVSFEAKPGQMIALVGPTGVGKTTMIQLAARFYDPTEGAVFVDGHDLRGIKQNSLRSRISMVLQDTFLFNGTIAANIAYAKPGATESDIVEASKVAGIYDDIMEMPDKYNTEVGERGLRLSGGQKQRVAIARAVLRDAPILILDEATASVDMQTEAQIQRAIHSLSGSRTVLAIAHRLSTIRNADLILVLEEGRIVQRGTHEKLVAVPGVYQELCKVQEQGARI